MNIIKRYKNRVTEITSYLNCTDETPMNKHIALNDIVLILFRHSDVEYVIVSKHPEIKAGSIMTVEDYYRQYKSYNKVITFYYDKLPQGKFSWAKSSIKKFINL